jgi:hypothetical protein
LRAFHGQKRTLVALGAPDAPAPLRRSQPLTEPVPAAKPAPASVTTWTQRSVPMTGGSVAIRFRALCLSIGTLLM